MTATPPFPQHPSSLASGTEPLKRIAIFAATVWEADAVRAVLSIGAERRIGGVRVWVSAVGPREYWLARTGVGPKKAGQVAAHVLAQQSFCLAVSTGFACALVAADIGALLAGHEVIRDRTDDSDSISVIDVPGVERDALLALVPGSGSSFHLGRFVSVAHIVGLATDKRRLAHGTGAIGLDMESAALAVEAEKAQVPFVVVRAVSDLVDEDLPLDFNHFLRPTAWLRGIATLLAAPSKFVELARLRRQSMVAAKSLTMFFKRYIAVQASGSIRAEFVTGPL